MQVHPVFFDPMRLVSLWAMGGRQFPAASILCIAWAALGMFLGLRRCSWVQGLRPRRCAFLGLCGAVSYAFMW